MVKIDLRAAVKTIVIFVTRIRIGIMCTGLVQNSGGEGVVLH
jgi:hypothetical protein